jgi:hypothetical protein
MIRARNFTAVRPSALHGTLCRCGRRAKKHWQVVCDLCWLDLPSASRIQIRRLIGEIARLGEDEADTASKLELNHQISELLTPRSQLRAPGSP